MVDIRSVRHPTPPFPVTTPAAPHPWLLRPPYPLPLFSLSHPDSLSKSCCFQLRNTSVIRPRLLPAIHLAWSLITCLLPRGLPDCPPHNVLPPPLPTTIPQHYTLSWCLFFASMAIQNTHILTYFVYCPSAPQGTKTPRAGCVSWVHIPALCPQGKHPDPPGSRPAPSSALLVCRASLYSREWCGITEMMFPQAFNLSLPSRDADSREAGSRPSLVPQDLMSTLCSEDQKSTPQ